MARKLEDGSYLLDAEERRGFAHAARLIERAEDRRIDLSLPLDEFDYLLLLAVSLVALGEDDAVEVIERAVKDCVEERRRNRH
jgi:hypothetical protein